MQIKIPTIVVSNPAFDREPLPLTRSMRVFLMQLNQPSTDLSWIYMGKDGYLPRRPPNNPAAKTVKHQLCKSRFAINISQYHPNIIIGICKSVSHPIGNKSILGPFCGNMASDVNFNWMDFTTSQESPIQL